MAENKTIEEQLAEADRIVAEKIAKEKAKKAAEAKADAEYKKREQTKERIAKENIQRASIDSAGDPQREVGSANKTRENLKKIENQVVATEYSQIIRTQNNLVEKYKKTGNAEDRQAAINYQAKVDAAAKKYSDVVGHAPTGYTGKLNLPAAPVTSTTSETVANQTATSDSAQGRDVARSAGRNAAPAPAVSSTSLRVDPNVVTAYMTANPGMTYDQAVAAIYPTAANAIGLDGVNGPSGAPSRTVSVDKRVQTFTVQQLEGAATQYAQQLLGRALTADELASVTKFTNAEAIANPQISKTVTNSNKSGSTSSTTTSGGIDEAQLLKSQIEANPEFASYQKATTYFDAMLGTLRGPVGGGI
jgi:hypothetical protein